MNCPKCQSEVLPGCKFCGECGAMLPEIAEEPVAEVVEVPAAEVAEEAAVEVAEEPAAEVVEEAAAEVAEEPAAEEAAPVEEVPVTTVYCPQCAGENQAGDRFCMKCGTSLEGVAPSAQPPVIAPLESAMDKVGEFAKKSADKVGKLAKKGAKEAKKLAEEGSQKAKKLAEEGSDKVKKLADEGSQKAKKLPKPVLFAILGIAAVIVIVAGLLLMGAVFGGSKDSGAFYLKDSEIYFSDLSKKDPVEITSRLMNDSSVDEYELTESSYQIASYMALSRQGSRLFYPDKIGDDNGMTIYYRDLGKPKQEPEKLDSDIVMYAINDDGTEVVYLKGESGDLYRSNLEEKEKLASDVVEFYITEDLKTVLFRNDENNLYQLKKGGEKEKIAGDITMLQYVSEDLSTVYYTKDDALYLQKVGKDRVKIDSDVASVGYVLENGAVYYTVSETEKVTMGDFVKDDMATADAAITEPVYPEYPSYPYSWNYDTDEEYEAAMAEYNSALAEYTMQEEVYWEQMDAYYAKQDRDALREELKGHTEEFTHYTLCYFDGKASTEILPGLTSSFLSSYAYEAAAAIVQAQEDSEEIRVNLSEITSVWDVSNLYYEAQNTDAKHYMVVGADYYQVDLEDMANVRISSDGTYLTYMEDVDEVELEGTLYQAQIGRDGLGEAQKLGEEVYAYSVYTLADDSMVYFKNVDTDDYIGDLYVAGQEVAYDVYISGVSYAEKLGGVLYYTDWDNDDGVGTLNLYKNKKSEKISDDVYSYAIKENGDLFYLYDYSLRHYNGSLYLYSGGKAKKVDEDVIALIPEAYLYQQIHGYNLIW